MAGTLKKCKYCNSYGLTKIGEAGHTRLYFCAKCERQTTQYLKKLVKCKHIFDDDRCYKCGYKKKEKYT